MLDGDPNLSGEGAILGVICPHADITVATCLIAIVVITMSM